MGKAVVKSEAQIAEDKANAKAMQTGNSAVAQNAFNKIYKRYKSPIFYTALRFVKMNEETAKDLTQEIFVKIWEKVHLYDFSTAFSTWFYNLAKNHLIDYKRKQNVEVLSMETLRSEFGGDEDVNEIAFQIEDKSMDTFKSLVKSERAGAVREAIESIKNEESRNVINLIFMNDMPYKDAADQLGLPLGTVKAIMFRAKKELKDFLSKKKTYYSLEELCVEKSEKKIKKSKKDFTFAN
jgi:RNA polymerase sigma factor (sigma-70 family)